ncbi:MAG: hypothetical protein B6V02_02540 [Thermoprotei archaeon ex4572_64]|nr:MAG: hypothetical protein B6V02_02540 [Thermoprotei archaeon ex4572_64]
MSLEWVKEFLGKDYEIIGTYLALLILRGRFCDTDFEEKPSIEVLNSFFREYTSLYVSFVGTDYAYHAYSVGLKFIIRLLEDHRNLKALHRNRVLEEIESNYYEIFKQAFLKFLRIEKIPEELREKLAELLRNIKLGAYDRSLTFSGSAILNIDITLLLFTSSISFDSLINVLEGIGIVKAKYPQQPYFIIPAPLLEDLVIERLLRRVEKVPEERVKLPKIVDFEKYKEYTLSKTLIEDFLTEFFQNLGFKISKYVVIELENGEKMYINMVCEREVENFTFKIWIDYDQWRRELYESYVNELRRMLILSKVKPNITIIITRKVPDELRRLLNELNVMIIEVREVERVEDFLMQIYKPLIKLILPEKMIEQFMKIRESLSKVISELSSVKELMEQFY